MSQYPAPDYEGHWWAKLVTPRGMPDGENWISADWEVVQVIFNGGVADEVFGVFVPGISVMQWPSDFTWGPRIGHASLNTFAAEIHRDNAKWWQNPRTGERIERNDGELLMLMVSEIAEGMEGLRKGLMDDKLPHRPMIEVEMADLFIRLMDFAGARSLDLDGAVTEKRAFNAVRADHSFEARLAANGKKF